MKKIKQIFELIGRLLLAFIMLFTNFVGIMPVLADNYTKGQIIESVNSNGSLDNPGDIKLTKTVEETKDEGIYKINFSVSGKDKIKYELIQVPIYAVVVLDTSSSMEDRCSSIVGPFTGTCYGDWLKYEDAKDGTKLFANNLISKYSNAQLALVSFSDEAKIIRNFSNSNFNNIKYPNPDGLTNLSDGIDTAKSLLEEKRKVNEDSKLYMIILTDGYPEEENVSDDIAANNAKKSADNSKKSKINIFTIGYDITKKDEELLKYIATDESYYLNADDSNLDNKFKNIVDKIDETAKKEKKLFAGTNAKLTDVIGNEFTYVQGSKSSDDITVNDKDVFINVGNINENEKTYSILVKINKDANDGLHNTNELCKLEYKNVDAIDESLLLNNSSKVYWEAQRYTYVVNYYKDSVSSYNYLGKVENNNILNAEIGLNDIELNKFKPIGYKDGTLETTLPYVIKEENNIINVVYKVKDDLSYIVEYYNDNNKISDDNDNTFGNKYFGEKITEDLIEKDKYLSTGYNNGYIKTIMPYTIIDNKNIIMVCYEKRNDMSYTVRYIDYDTNKSIISDKVVKNKTYNEEIEEFAEYPYGYNLVSENVQKFKLDSDGKVITFYYNKIKAKYVVRYLEEETNLEILPSIKKEGNLIDKVTEEAKNIKGYDLVSDDKVTIELNKEEVSEIIFYYKKKDINYTVKYLDNETKSEIAPSVKKEGKYLDEVTEKSINIDGYKLVSFNEVKIKLDEENKTIVFYYEKEKVEVKEVVKTGVNDDNNYLLLTLLFSAVTSLGYVLKKRFN